MFDNPMKRPGNMPSPPAPQAGTFARNPLSGAMTPPGGSGGMTPSGMSMPQGNFMMGGLFQKLQQAGKTPTPELIQAIMARRGMQPGAMPQPQPPGQTPLNNASMGFAPGQAMPQGGAPTPPVAQGQPTPAPRIRRQMPGENPIVPMNGAGGYSNF